MQAGGARGAVGEAGVQLRSHPASSGALSAGRCTLATPRAREDRAGTLRSLQGADLALWGPRAWEGWAPSARLPAPRRPPPIGRQPRTPRRRSRVEQGADPPEPSPGRLGDAQPAPQLVGLRGVCVGVCPRPELLQSRLTLRPGSGDVLRSLFTPRSCCCSGSQKRDLPDSQHPHSAHFLRFIYLLFISRISCSPS